MVKAMGYDLLRKMRLTPLNGYRFHITASFASALLQLWQVGRGPHSSIGRCRLYRSREFR